ncbi:vasculin [Xenopus laevis]|uniref:Vasculin n=1 Tax=Xenopus laevis TaxID=8355 RepID=GPBP1_XENLA|nr:vasculin [Xenopus laevis]Q6DD19.1 RecName: Full=Vasculin; AltName: Full=GC-rich promoter-binding protein 1 [Xenopus laevis]AAH77810.1 MGC80437 protein [Xenopus laevis]
MAQHDFAPAWLNFPTPPPSTKPFLYAEKRSESLGRSDCAFNVNRQRHNSSEAFDSSFGGNLKKREKNVWRPQSRSAAEPTWQREASLHLYSSNLQRVNSQLRSERNTSEFDLTRSLDREDCKTFEAEDFSFLYPEHERGKKLFTARLWEYPMNAGSTSPQMLGIKKGLMDDFSLSGYSIGVGNQSLPDKHWAGIKKEECKSLSKDNNIGSFYQDCPPENYIPNTSLHAELLSVDPCSLEEEEDTHLNNRNDSCPEMDINLNFDENENSEDNVNTLISGQISPAYAQDGVLSSSLEAEFKLLREMGWQENDESCAPLTEDEMREFQAISEQLQKNGLRKHVFLRDALAFDLFQDAVQKEDSETSSSDTSDDE